MFGHFQLQRRKVDYLTAAVARNRALFQRMATRLAVEHLIEDRVVRVFNPLEPRTRVPFLSSRLLAARFAQALGLWLFVAVCRRGLATVLTVFRQLSTQFLVLGLKQGHPGL